MPTGWRLFQPVGLDPVARKPHKAIVSSLFFRTPYSCVCGCRLLCWPTASAHVAHFARLWLSGKYLRVDAVRNTGVKSLTARTLGNRGVLALSVSSLRIKSPIYWQLQLLYRQTIHRPPTDWSSTNSTPDHGTKSTLNLQHCQSINSSLICTCTFISFLRLRQFVCK